MSFLVCSDDPHDLRKINTDTPLPEQCLFLNNPIVSSLTPDLPSIAKEHNFPLWLIWSSAFEPHGLQICVYVSVFHASVCIWVYGYMKECNPEEIIEYLYFIILCLKLNSGFHWTWIQSGSLAGLVISKPQQFLSLPPTPSTTVIVICRNIWFFVWEMRIIGSSFMHKCSYPLKHILSSAIYSKEFLSVHWFFFLVNLSHLHL